MQIGLSYQEMRIENFMAPYYFEAHIHFSRTMIIIKMILIKLPLKISINNEI